MKRITLLCLFMLAAVPALAQTADTPMLACERLSVGLGVERAWAFESLDVGTQIGQEYFLKVPVAYTLSTQMPVAITARAEKSLTSRHVGLRVGLQVILFHGGQSPGGK